MARKVAPVLNEILKAIAGIQEALAGKTFADFEHEWLLNHGVQRGIEIISEATRHLHISSHFASAVFSPFLVVNSRRQGLKIHPY
jgi:uncharacterized protein with HEPN domain